MVLELTQMCNMQQSNTSYHGSCLKDLLGMKARVMDYMLGRRVWHWSVEGEKLLCESRAFSFLVSLIVSLLVLFAIITVFYLIFNY